jgi:hypothetical protein
MVSNRRVLIAAFAINAGFIMAGCGGNASMSPVAPSGTSLDMTAGAVITGVVTSAGTATASTMAAPRRFVKDATSSVTISVSGTGITTTTDGQGRFVLTGVPGGNVVLQITGPNTNATVTLMGVSANDHIDLVLTVKGNQGEIDSDHRTHGQNGVDANGLIAAIDTVGRTITVGTKTFSVPTTASIRHGSTTLTLADLHVGDHVEIKGHTDGTTLVADEIKVETPDSDEGPNGAELNGSVAGLAGTCPAAVTFMIQTTKVTTNASTTFSGIACTAIKNGTVVEVEGVKQTDGSVVASSISQDD